MVPGQITAIDLTLEVLADSLAALAEATMETDREASVVLAKCREGLRAIAWERFRLRHEASSQARAAARRRRAFVARHKAVRADA